MQMLSLMFTPSKIWISQMLSEYVDWSSYLVRQVLLQVVMTFARQSGNSCFPKANVWALDTPAY